ncbi:hypothetical protein F5883DRAFT_652594 [Diaporthe sp. PMI_573]|nr:hypothetical protein F5883DRAFT_655062 [Diaporthaceae sp. PMI_573]KAH8749730.1 hypothetical protein F5883DRAFT_652594 [Diaporthaceae sp. PMI_573]
MAAPAPSTNTVLGPVMWRTIDGRRYALFRAETNASRTHLNRLAITDEETTALQRQSHNVPIRIFANEDVHLVAAKIIRLPNLFRAFIIASRGLFVHPCTNECASPETARFRGCKIIPGFEGGSCAECVYHSDGHRCEHHFSQASPDDSSSWSEDDDSSA